MKELKGTKTEKNLREAFAGESQAAISYEYFAKQAKKDGYEFIASIFEKTAGQEKEHAKKWFKYLNGGSVPSTLDNLNNAANGENHEWTEMYVKMAEEAKKEGFVEIAAAMLFVANVEEEHEMRYRKLAAYVKNNTFFDRQEEVRWECRNCGHVVQKNKKAPIACPTCQHPQSYFEVKFM
ncbi:MAG: rubrerythrin family protein [Firmicutes bacterium]|nr:rubrerythrin family protein [Bacillota bacterium]